MVSAFDTIRPVDHQVVEGVTYTLEVDVTAEKGTTLETTIPLTLLSSEPADNKVVLEVAAGAPQYCVGILAARKKSTDTNRGIAVIVHGVALARNASDNGNGTLIPGRLWQSATGGYIDYATDGLYARGKIIDPIPTGKSGRVTVF